MARLTIISGKTYSIDEFNVAISFIGESNESSIVFRFKDGDAPPFLGGELNTHEIIKLRDFLSRLLEDNLHK